MSPTPHAQTAFETWCEMSELQLRAIDREHMLVGYILTGRETQILGQRARIRIDWPDGLPRGFTEEDIREYGEKLLRST